MAGFKESVKPAVFDGSNWFDTPILNLPATMSEFSLSVRVFMVDDEIRQDPLGILGTFIIRVQNQSIGVLWWNASGLIFQTTPAQIAGAESFITATYKQGDALRIYLNGVEIYSTSNSVSTPLEYVAGEILRVGNAVDRVVAGTEISSAEAYTQALTPDQIKTLYGQGVGIPAKLLKTYGLDSGLLAGYDLHGENPLVDLSGNGNHLANVNNVTFDGDAVDVVYQPLQTVVGAEFDGTNLLNDPTPRPKTGVSKFSVGCWFKLDSSAGTEYIISGDGIGKNSWHIRKQAGQKVYCVVRNDANQAQDIVYNEPSDTEVNFVVMNVDSESTIDIYMNGEKVVSDVFNLSLPFANQNTGICIGSRRPVLDTPLSGSVWGSFEISDSTLTPEDIKTLYNQGVGVDLKKLPSRLKDSAVGLYPLDDLLDYSGNGNDLINVNNVALTATKQGQRLLDKPPTELVLTGNMAYMPASSTSTIELATADRYTAEGIYWTASCFVDILSPLNSRTGILKFRDHSGSFVKIQSNGQFELQLPAPGGLYPIVPPEDVVGLHHLCVTSGDRGLEMYWDGVLIASNVDRAAELIDSTATSYTNWGRSGSTTNDRMNGSLSSCAFFLSEASMEDIEDLANNTAYESLRTDFKATCKEFITLTENVPSTGLQHTNLVTGNIVDKAQHSGFTVPTIDYKIKL